METILVRSGEVVITLNSGDVITAPWSPAPQVRKRQVITPAGKDEREQATRPIRAEARARLIESVAKARLWLDGLISGRFISTAQIAANEQCSERSVRLTLSLAFLPPETVKAAIEGRLPREVTLSTLCEPPISWAIDR